MNNVTATGTPAQEAARGFEQEMRFVPINRGEKAPKIKGWTELEYSFSDVQPGLDAGTLNAGLILGAKSGGIVDIDLDCPEAVSLAQKFLCATRTFGRRSKRKSHYLYRIIDTLPETQQFEDPIKGEGAGDGGKNMIVEVRSTGCQTVYPDSQHPSAELVEWDGDESETITEISADELVDSVRKIAAAALYARHYPADGIRQKATMALAGVLARASWCEDDTIAFVEAVFEIALMQDEEDLDDLDRRRGAVRDTFDAIANGEKATGFPAFAKIVGKVVAETFCKWLGIERKAQSKGGGDVETDVECTDIGNRNRFIRLHGDNVRYNPNLGKWSGWDKRRWRVDSSGTVGMTLAREVAASIFDEAKTPDRLKQKLLSEHAVRTHNHNALVRLVAQAETSPELVAELSRFDQDGFTLNVLNGTIDLRTGKLRKHRREDYITKLAPVVYDPNATAPRWEQFLKEIFDGDEGLIAYVQRAVGYSLTGATREQVFFVLHGEGSNGKGTFIDTIMTMLGSRKDEDIGYALEPSPEVILEDPYGRSDARELLRLPGARLVKVAEIAPDRKLNQSLVKRITGEDAISARALYKEAFSFVPVCKLWLVANDRPQFDGIDFAMQRRIKSIPFNAVFDNEQPGAVKKDDGLRGKLWAELPGILVWAVRGCLAWQSEGVGTCDAVKAATTEYIRENDAIAEFLDECCDRISGAEERVEDFRGAYLNWARKNNKKEYPAPTLGKELKKKGIVSKKENIGSGKERSSELRYTGIKLKERAAIVPPVHPSAPPPLSGK